VARRLLVAALEDAVERARPQLAVGVVDRGGAGVGEPAHGAAGLANCLEHAHRPRHVDERAADRIGGHERHLEPGEVDDVRRLVLGEHALEVAVAREVALHKGDRVDGLGAGDLPQPPRLGAEVEGHARHALGHELAQHPGADAALAAGDQEAFLHDRKRGGAAEWRQVASGGVEAIAVDGLEKRYGDVHAVRGVSFGVARGETFGILGPNGAGKTTTLEMIEGLTRPDAGSIAILGQDVWPSPTRVQGHIGVQLQKNALFEHLTASELLDLFARFYGVPLEGRAPRLLALVGLDEKADAQARQLSGGQQQRLAIALALVHDPEIVFLDEPTTGLDPQARRNLWDVIRAVAAQNRTVVLTTHYLDEAETLCDRVAIMDGGRIIALDTPQALIAGLQGRSRVIFEGDGLSDDALAALEGVQRVASADGAYELTSVEPQHTLVGLVALADRQGVALRGLAVRQPTLEDVFLDATGTEFRQ